MAELLVHCTSTRICFFFHANFIDVDYTINPENRNRNDCICVMTVKGYILMTTKTRKLVNLFSKLKLKEEENKNERFAFLKRMLVESIQHNLEKFSSQCNSNVLIT
jgi:hypothetical protein